MSIMIYYIELYRYSETVPARQAPSPDAPLLSGGMQGSSQPARNGTEQEPSASRRAFGSLPRAERWPRRGHAVPGAAGYWWVVGAAFCQAPQGAVPDLSYRKEG